MEGLEAERAATGAPQRTNVLNRGRKNIVVNMKHAKGPEIIKKLVFDNQTDILPVLQKTIGRIKGLFAQR